MTILLEFNQLPQTRMRIAVDIFKINDPSGKMCKESYVSKNFTEEYEFIIQKINTIFVYEC